MRHVLSVLPFLVGTTAGALAADNLIPGNLALLKPAALVKGVYKATTTFQLPAYPLGAFLNVFDTIAPGAGYSTYALPAAQWIGLGRPAGSKGWKYKGAGSSTDPCRLVLVKANVLKHVCKGSGIALTPPVVGDLGVVLNVGDQRYCAQFGGNTKKNAAGLFKRKDAPPPTACPPSGTLFVTASEANKVFTIDVATGGILASADTETHPVGVEKANGKVYVANETSGTISVFDSAMLSPLTVIPACGKPHHTATSPDGTRFYAACLATNKVAVVDTETDTLVGLLTSGAPGALTHQPWPTKDGERLWVANFETDDVTEIDLQTGGILRVFPLPARPIEVVVPANAKTAYVSVPALSKMMVFDLETSQLVAEPIMLAPENLWLSGDGKTILSSWAGVHNPTAVSIFDTETLTSVNVTLPGVSASHTDLTPDAKFGFVSINFGTSPGIAVVDIEAATVRVLYPTPGSASPHAVRYAPGPP